VKGVHMIKTSQKEFSSLKQDNEDTHEEEIQAKDETANDIRDDKDNRKKDMENHISEHDVVLDMGSGNEALTLFNENEEHILTTEFFIIDETKEYEFPVLLEMNTHSISEKEQGIELFELLSPSEDTISFEFIEIFNQENTPQTSTKTQELDLSLKSYLAQDYANQEILVYKHELDAIYKEDYDLIMEL